MERYFAERAGKLMQQLMEVRRHKMLCTSLGALS